MRAARLCVLHVLWVAAFLTGESRAQAPTSRPAVYVRQVRIDSILLVFGVDSTRVRSAVERALRDARRLATEAVKGVPSLDVDVTVPRALGGGMFDPRGYVRIEVGRNLVEEGTARSPLWTGMRDLPPSPTWHQLGRGTLAEVVKVVNDYLLGRSGGA